MFDSDLTFSKAKLINKFLLGSIKGNISPIDLVNPILKVSE